MIEFGKITLLNNIQVDRTLPKHVKVVDNNDINVIDVSSEDGFNISLPTISSGSVNDIHLDHLHYIYSNTHSLFVKFKIWLYKRMYAQTYNFEINATKKNISSLNLNDFFNNVKLNITELKYWDIVEIINKYNTVLSNAKNNKQIALSEKIEGYAEILRYEMILSLSQFSKFLEEADVVKFHEKASKHNKLKTNLCLTYIKNFIKIIPEDISALKIKADELKVFDNYVILHYDYNGNAVADTKAEAEKKKDPILFGVIKNSRRLYYIGDWVDDYCDLTLDVIIKKLGIVGIEKIELNKETIVDGISKNS